MIYSICFVHFLVIILVALFVCLFCLLLLFFIKLFTVIGHVIIGGQLWWSFPFCRCVKLLLYWLWLIWQINFSPSQCIFYTHRPTKYIMQLCSPYADFVRWHKNKLNYNKQKSCTMPNLYVLRALTESIHIIMIIMHIVDANFLSVCPCRRM